MDELEGYLPAGLQNQALYADGPAGPGTLKGFHAKVAEVFQLGRSVGYDEASEPLTGDQFTDGASAEEEYCGCGEPITWYDGEWLHIINPVLRGTDDHDARPLSERS